MTGKDENQTKSIRKNTLNSLIFALQRMYPMHLCPSFLQVQILVFTGNAVIHEINCETCDSDMKIKNYGEDKVSRFLTDYVKICSHKMKANQPTEVPKLSAEPFSLRTLLSKNGEGKLKFHRATRMKFGHSNTIEFPAAALCSKNKREKTGNFFNNEK